VTLRDLAQHCGVSIATVRWSLAGDERHVSAATMARVRAVAQELEYNPMYTHGARRLVLRRLSRTVSSHTVSIHLPEWSLQANYFNALLFGTLSTLQRQRYGVLLNLVNADDLPLPFTHGDVDGAIIYAVSDATESLLAQLRAYPGFGLRPVVTLAASFPGCSAVCPDDRQGGYLAAKHLLALGHRHIAHFYEESFFPKDRTSLSGHPFAQRVSGYFDACHEVGADPSEVLHHISYQQYREDPYRFAETLRKSPRVTAILARHDSMAQEIYQVLRNAGLRIPQDYSLMGYDDSHAIPNAQGENLLTTVQVPLTEMGEQAAQLLLSHIAADDDVEMTTITLPTSLVVRTSTAEPGK